MHDHIMPGICLGYDWIGSRKWNGVDWNIMECDGSEWNEIKMMFHCLDIL